MRTGDVAVGQLDLLLLAALARLGAGHGYAVIRAVRDHSDGALDVPEGSVYPAFQRLEREGLIVGEWDESGPRPRRVYRLTPAGSVRLHERSARWREVASGVDAVLRWAL
jgi:DNA-binding PadR family transcriptional regulator